MSTTSREQRDGSPSTLVTFPFLLFTRGSSSHLQHSLRSHDVILVREEGAVVPVRGTSAPPPVLPLPLLVVQVVAAPRQPQLRCVIHCPGKD